MSREVGHRRPTIDVRDFGAIGDGKQLATAALERAVIEASKLGATVLLPTGTYRVGTVPLRSDIRLVIETGATLLASRMIGDFLEHERLPYPTYADLETSDFRHGLLIGDGLHDVTITGDGTIDMQRDARFGPKPIALRRCTGVEISGITIRNSPNYCLSLGACDDVLVEGITIRDGFSDGIDPDSCRRVSIRDCDIESDDDALCIKSSLFLGEPRSCEDVVVRDCRLNSPSNGFKIGTETSGDVRHVDVRGCRIDGTPRTAADPAGLVLAHEGGGIAIESVDGADVSDIRVSDTTIEACNVPIFIRLGARGRGQPVPVPGSIRNVTISGVSATGATDACTISGIPGHPVQVLTLEAVTVAGVPTAAPPAAPVPEREAEYPQAGMFGALPASSLYAAPCLGAGTARRRRYREQRRPAPAARHRRRDRSGRGSVGHLAVDQQLPVFVVVLAIEVQADLLGDSDRCVVARPDRREDRPIGRRRQDGRGGLGREAATPMRLPDDPTDLELLTARQEPAEADERSGAVRDDVIAVPRRCLFGESIFEPCLRGSPVREQTPGHRRHRRRIAVHGLHHRRIIRRERPEIEASRSQHRPKVREYRKCHGRGCNRFAVVG